MTETQKQFMTKENVAKALEECRKIPNNCNACPFSDKDKITCCIPIISTVTDEMEAEYKQKYHPHE